jgi:outer membrane cobalamin receptor
MVLRRVILRALAGVPLLGLIGPTGCASSGGGTNSGRLEQPEGQVVSEEQIAKSGARTAWDALRLTVHNITFNETGRGQPSRITRRGRSSMLLDDGPRILVDGVALTDYTVLARMPATDLLSIEVLSAMDATTLYGTNYSGGVIRIHTKTGS